MLCDEVKLKSVVDEHASCYRKAELSMIKKIASSDTEEMESGLCRVITQKVDCIELHASKCLAPERVDMMRKNFLSTEISKANSNSNSDTLGQKFVTSCHVLSDHQTDFVRTTFGLDVCSYDQVSENINLKYVINFNSALIKTFLDKKSSLLHFTHCGPLII